MWIFDNQVEHASRENGRGSWLDHSHNVSPSQPFERCGGGYSSDLRRLDVTIEVSNESLILAQNQRWRRA